MFRFPLKHVLATLGVLAGLTVKNFPLKSQPKSGSDTYLNAITLSEQEVQQTESDTVTLVLELQEYQRRSLLTANGVVVMRALGDRAFVVRTCKSTAAALNKIVPCHLARDTWKLDRALVFKHGSRKYWYVVKASGRAALERVLRHAERLKPIACSPEALRIYASMDEIRKQIISLDEVVYVGQELHAAETESRVLDLYLAPNSVNTVHRYYPDLSGAGVTLSIKERMFDKGDLDIIGRYIESSVEGEGTDNHATDMATIAAGAGNSFVTGRGVAKGARLSSSDFANLFPDQDEVLSEVNVSVQNHAYGTVIENIYGLAAEAYDASAIRLRDVVHVFSAGNSGMETPMYGTYAGISGVANMTGNFKMAKNIITVGAVDTVGRIQPFSSRGPAYDGRVKPELVAYSSQGSSNAAAVVSGVSVLLQEAYQRSHGEAAPAALIKAVLLNSARDVGVEGIDFSSGYGNVDAFKAVDDMTALRFFSGSVGDGESISFDIDLPSGVKQFKATLVWNDPPAGPGSAVALVNDLDFSVIGGLTWLPWVLDSSPGSDLLLRSPTRNYDRINNVEQVTINDPEPGVYNLKVEGFDVSEGPQEFYIAWSFQLDDYFEWRAPVLNDNFPYDGETGTYFFWESTLSETVGNLEYRILPDGEWTLIDDNVALSGGAFRWSSVPDVTATAQARFVVGGDYFPTEVFTISRPTPVSLGFNCGDSVMMKWPHLEGVEAYELYTIEPGVGLEPLLTTSDTSVILSTNDSPSRLFSVRAVVDGVPALRGPTFDVDALGTECFLSSFYNVVDPAEGIRLYASLGTTYGVSVVEVQREEVEGFVTIGTIDIENSTDLQFLDADPLQGLNRYRLILHFVNGEQYTSWITEDFFFTTVPFAVFPNPLTQSRELAVFSKVLPVYNAVFRLFRTDGVLVKQISLSSDRESIVLDDVASGMYLFTITASEGVLNGRLVVP